MNWAAATSRPGNARQARGFARVERAFLLFGLFVPGRWDSFWGTLCGASGTCPAPAALQRTLNAIVIAFKTVNYIPPLELFSIRASAAPRRRGPWALPRLAAHAVMHQQQRQGRS
jgi:hypothetical protein